MTCKEKLRQDHPEWSDEKIDDVIKSYCPDDYGYPPGTWCNGDCKDQCWDREIPDSTTPPKEEVKTELPPPQDSSYYLAAEICTVRKQFIDAGFSAREAFDLIWAMFKSRWKQ